MLLKNSTGTHHYILVKARVSGLLLEECIFEKGRVSGLLIEGQRVRTAPSTTYNYPITRPRTVPSRTYTCYSLVEEQHLLVLVQEQPQPHQLLGAQRLAVLHALLPCGPVEGQRLRTPPSRTYNYPGTRPRNAPSRTYSVEGQRFRTAPSRTR